jgi:hypothetical protein
MMFLRRRSTVFAGLIALLLALPAVSFAQSLTLAGLYSVDTGVNSTSAAFRGVQMDSARNIYLLLDEGDGVRVLKLNPAGTAALASVHLGAAGDHGTAFAIDSGGNIYVTGIAGSGVLATTSGAAHDFPSAQSSFVAGFNPSLRENFMTSTGGTFASATSVAVTASAIYVTGTMQGQDLPVTGNGIVLTFPASSTETGFIEGFNLTGTKLNYATYLGGPNGNTVPAAIAADSSGNIIVTGSDTATGFPTVNGLQPELVGSSDLFLIKLSPAVGIEWSTLMGSANGVVSGRSVALSTTGAVIVGANSTTLGLPVTSSLMPLPTATDWAMVLEFTADGSAINFSTVLGDGELHTITLDSSGNIWAGGMILHLAAWPLTTDIQHTGIAFITELSSAGNLVYSTRLGGIASYATTTQQSATAVNGIAVAANGTVAIAGGWTNLQATANWLPGALDLPYVNAPNAALSGTLATTIAPGACQNAEAGCGAGYVAELSPAATAQASLSVDTLPNLSLRSTGAKAFTVSAVSASGYLVATDCAAAGSLATGSACNIVLTGNGPGTLTFETSAGNFSFPLTGAALSSAQNPVTLQPKEAVFAGYGPADAANQIITASNLTAQPQIVSPSGNAEQAFSLQQGSCTLGESGSNYTLAANTTCTLAAVFADPATQSPQDGALAGNVTTEISQEPVNAVNFYAYELAESHPTTDAPSLVASTSDIDFGTQYIGGPVTQRTVVIANATAASVSPAFVATPSADPNFVVTDLCPVVLPAYTSCLVEVAYNSSVTSADSASLVLPTGGTLNLSGVTLQQPGAGGLSANPSISVSPSSLSFGGIGVGDITTAQTVSVTNAGNVAASIVISASANFSEIDNCNGAVAANSACTVQIAFAPTTLGVLHGQLAVTPSGSSPVDVALSGGGVAAVNFGTILLGAGSTQWVSLGSFVGNATASVQGPFEAAVVNGYSYNAPPSIQFGVSSTTSCTAGCYVGIRAIAANTGTQSGTLTLAEQNNETITYPLTAAAMKQPAALLNSYSHTFGAIPVGSSSALQLFTVSNPGNAAVSLGTPAVSAGFRLQSACGSSLAAGASCEIGVAFLPTSIGQIGGTLSVTVGGSLLVAQLSGNGASNPADISFSPASLVFFAPAGASSQSVTVTNLSSSPRVIAQISAGGNAFFTMSNNCGTLQPAGSSGSSCTLQISVTAVKAGAGIVVPLSLLVNVSNASYSYTLPVSAIPSGLGLGSISLQASPAALSFPALNIGEASAPENLVITNNASTTTTVQITAPAQFSVDNTNCATLAAGASCTVPVRFTPFSAGSISDSIFIQGAGAEMHVAVTGSAAAATRVASPAYPPLVQPVASGGETQTLQVTNAGNEPLLIQEITGNYVVTGNTCTAAVAAGASCNVTVQTLLDENCGSSCGGYSADANLTILSNAESSPDTFVIQQTYAPESGASTMPGFALSAASLTFPQTATGQSATLQLQIQSNGSAPLTTAFRTTGDFSQTNNCGGQIAGYSGAGGYPSCTVTLTFAPKTGGFRSGTVQIATNAGLQTVSLGGNSPAGSGAVTTSTALLTSAASIPSGESETLAVSVLPASGNATPTGSVAFYASGKSLGSVPLQSGEASYTASTRGLAAGTYLVTAKYSGDSGNLPSTSPQVAVTITAGPNITATTLTASPQTVAAGGSTTLTAAVTRTGGSGAPGGTVTFLYGSNLLGSATLASGTATLTISSNGFSAGRYSIVANYAGDTADLPSSSPPVTIHIEGNVAATQTGLTATPSTLTEGSQVTLQATVSETSGSATPTGTVTFQYGAMILGSSPLYNGVATLSASASVAAGVYGIHATYSGDTNNAASTSAVVNVTVQAPTAVTLTAMPTTVHPGQPVNLSATVRETKGNGTPGGSVFFYANGTLLASTTVLNGVAVYSAPTTGMPAGTYSITGNYTGDSLDALSVSPPITVTIN